LKFRRIARRKGLEAICCNLATFEDEVGLKVDLWRRTVVG